MRQLPIETGSPRPRRISEYCWSLFSAGQRIPPSLARVGGTHGPDDRGGHGQGTPLEVVREFALPIQSHALTYLLNVPESEAATRGSEWGTHVFHDGGSGRDKGGRVGKSISVANSTLRWRIRATIFFFSALDKSERFAGARSPATRCWASRT